MNSRRERSVLMWSFVCTVSLLFLLHLVGPIVVFLASGTPSYAVGIGLEFMWRTIGLGILLGVFSFYQYLLYGHLRTKVHHWAIWSTLALFPVVLFGARSVYHSLPSVRAEQILGTGELASLPQSATTITVYTWSTPFSGEEYLKFRASREDIEAFVAKSPILKGAEYSDYSTAKMRLLDGKQNASIGGNGAPDVEYIRHHRTVPPWYMEEIRWRARRYRIRCNRYDHTGEVIIDRENDVIFVKLSFD